MPQFKSTISIKDELLEWDMAGVYIISSGLKLSALIDTGSYYNLIRPEFVLGKVTSSLDEVSRPDTTDRHLRPQFLIDFCFENSSQIFTESFAAMENDAFAYDIIIGTQFLRRCKSFTYCGSENYFELVI